MPDPPRVDVNGYPAQIRLRDDGSDAITESVPDEKGMVATVEFLVDWATRQDFLKALAGSATLAGGVAVRTPPFAYPPNPELYCSAIGEIRGIKPRRTDSGWIEYRKAVVPAVFKKPSWLFDAADPAGQNDPSGVPWTTTRFRVSSEVLSPPAGSYYFANGGPVPQSSLGFVRPRAEISLTRHWMPWVPLQESMELAGACNEFEIRIGNRIFPRGCILYGGMNATDSVDTLGNKVFEVEYIFLGNFEVEWNEIMDRDGAWKLVNTAADLSGDYPFFYDDLWGKLP